MVLSKEQKKTLKQLRKQLNKTLVKLDATERSLNILVDDVYTVTEELEGFIREVTE